MHSVDTMYFSVCACGVKVTAEIQSEEIEEGKERQQLKEDLKTSQTLSGEATGKDAKDAKKLSQKSAASKKGIWNAEFF